MSTQKKSIVKRITHNTGSYESQGGTIYKHMIEFDNGDKGTYNSKDQTCKKFEEGTEAEYTIEIKQNGKWRNVIIKPVSASSENNSYEGFKNKNSNTGNDGFCLSYAKDLGVAYIGKGNTINPKQICDWADVFVEWMKKSKEKTQKNQNPEITNSTNKNNDDLHF